MGGIGLPPPRRGHSPREAQWPTTGLLWFDQVAGSRRSYKQSSTMYLRQPPLLFGFFSQRPVTLLLKLHHPVHGRKTEYFFLLAFSQIGFQGPINYIYSRLMWGLSRSTGLWPASNLNFHSQRRNFVANCSSTSTSGGRAFTLQTANSIRECMYVQLLPITPHVLL